MLLHQALQEEAAYYMNDLKESLVGEGGKTPHTYLYSYALVPPAVERGGGRICVCGLRLF
jgi:hypothetical protein